MPIKITERQVTILTYLIMLLLLVGIGYFILVIIGIYLDAFGYQIEPFYTSYSIFRGFDTWLKKMKIPLYLFYIFFILTLIAPLIIFYNEVLREKIEEISKEIEELEGFH
ncbi:MAG: hypothetical protein ACP6IS_04275 [Candidatus Asgardarchaeia archaeon]